MATDPPDDVDGWFDAESGAPETRTEVPTVVPRSIEQAPITPERRTQVAETLSTYEREIAASVDPRRRGMLAYEIGRIHEQVLGDDSRAIRFYQRAYHSDPTHLPTIQAGQRVFARAGRWGMVLQLAEAEGRVNPSIERRALLLVHQSDILLVRFGRPAEALSMARRALALRPDDPDIARCVAQLATIADAPDVASAVLPRAARHEADPVLIHGLTLAAANTMLAHDDLDGARRVLDAMLAEHPDQPEALALLSRLHRARNAWPEYIEVSAALAATLPPPGKARLLTDLARTCAEQLDDVVGALALLEQAILADARAPMALELIVELRTRNGQWHAAAEGLARLATITTDTAVRVDLLWQLAQIRLEKMGDEEGATRALRALLADAPTWAPAVRMLGRLLDERGDWDGVVALHTAELMAMTDPTARAARYFKIGEVHELQRNDPGAAGAAYRRAVDHDPDFKQAGKALARMLIRLGDWEGYVELLEAEADRADDVEGAVYVLSRVAEVSALNLDDPQRALATWQRVIALDPRNLEAVRNTARLCARLGRWDPLLAANEQELALLDGTRGRLHLLVRSAEIAERALSDLDRARGYLERALALDPKFLPALQAMGRIARRMRRWSELAELYLAEVALTTSAREQVAIWSKLGELRSDQLEDVEGAIVAYESALKTDPTHLPSIRALQRLYAQCGDARGEARMISAEVEQVPDAQARAALLDRLARLYAERLARPDAAADAWQRALVELPDFRRALQGLIDTQTAAADYEALALTHRQLAEAATTPSEAVAHWLEVARISEAHLGACVTAGDALELVLRLEPDNVTALLALERLYMQQARSQDLVDIYGQLLKVVRAPVSCADLLCRRARLFAHHLDAPEDALADYLAALELAPDRAEAIVWVEEYAAHEGDVERLALVLQRRLAMCAAPNERQAVLVHAAEALRRAGQLSEAAGCYEAVLQLDPDAVVSMRALREIYEKLGDRKRVLRLAEDESRRSLDPRTAASLLVGAGITREEEDAEGALAVYLEALARNPGDEAALSAVKRRCERDGRWDVLADALEERAFSELDEDARAVQIIEAANVRARRLHDNDGAVELLSRAIALDASPPPLILQRLGDLLVETGAWREAADVYATLCGVSSDADLRRAVVYRLASIYEDKLGDLERAGECLELILDEHPDEISALPRLARVYQALGETEQAHRVYLEAVERETDPLRGADFKQQLALIEANAGRLARATTLLAEVIDVTPDAEDAATRFAALCVQQGAADLLVRVLGAAIERVAAQAGTANRLRRILSEALVPAGGRSDDAVAILEQAIAAAAGDAELRAAHAALAERYPEHQRSALASRRWLALQRPFDTFNLQALRALLSRMGRDDAAYEVARLLIAFDAALPEDREAVQRWNGRLRRWPVRPIGEPERTNARVAGEPSRFIDVLATLSAALPEVFSPPTDATRAPPIFMRVAHRVATALGCPPPVVTLDERPIDQAAASPDGIVLSADLSQLSTNEQAFWIATHLEVNARGASALSTWPPAQLRHLLTALAMIDGYSVRGVDANDATISATAADLAPLVHSCADPRLPDALDQLRGLLPTVKLAVSRASVVASASRVALLCCGGVLPGINAMHRLEHAPLERTLGLADLVRWTVSEPYAVQRRAVGLAPGR